MYIERYNMLLTPLLERTMTQEEDRKGCLMAMVLPVHAKIIQNWSKKYIPEDILYYDGSDYGREMDTHATIFYGFTPDINDEQVKGVIKNTLPFNINLLMVDVFDTNPNYDVVILKVNSPELIRLNSICKKFPNENEYPDYKQHITLAYVRSGEGSKYKGIKAVSGGCVLCNTVEYSSSNGKKSKYELNNQSISEAVNISPPPAIQQQAMDYSFSNDFMDFVKHLESPEPIEAGYSPKKRKWMPVPSVEGGRKTIGYGHKMKTEKEEQQFNDGITDSEAVDLLKRDLMEARDKVRRYIDKTYRVHLILDKRQMEMLTELTFNVGGLEKFPKFTDAVLKRDWEKAKQHYKRSYKSSDGSRKNLTRRNNLFFNRYLK